jgi:hypothetical protein
MLGIDSWFMNLPSAYDFTSTQTSQCPIGQRMGLAFLFYSTKIEITHPCLCRLDSSPPEDDKTHEFCNKTAAECVESACHMLTLFPDNPDAAMLHRISPWWCTLHYLMQATTVLLLELAFHSQHIPEKANMVLKAAKKAIDWLSALSKTNMASERAWKLCDGFLRRLEPHIGIDANEMSDNEGSSSNSLFDAPGGIGSTEFGDDRLVDDPSFDQSSTLAVVPVPTAESFAAEMDSIACSPIKPHVSPLDMSVPYNIETPDLWIH